MMYKKYTLLFLMLCFTLPLTAMQMEPSVAAPASVDRLVAYADLIDHDSQLWQSCKGKSFAERVQLLCGCDLVAEIPVDITVSGVPHRDGSLTQVRVHLVFDRIKIDVEGYDVRNEKCFRGYISAPKAYLNRLDTEPIPGTCRAITGNTAMLLWEGIWELCGARCAGVCDDAYYKDYTLRAILPYVHGRSWYMKFGYTQDCIAPEVYAAAVQYMAKRSLESLIKEKSDTSGYPVLITALSLLKLPKFVALGECIKKLYLGWRYGFIIDEYTQEQTIIPGWSRDICAKALKYMDSYVLRYSGDCKEKYTILHPDLEKQNKFL